MEDAIINEYKSNLSNGSFPSPVLIMESLAKKGINTPTALIEFTLINHIQSIMIDCESHQQKLKLLQNTAKNAISPLPATPQTAQNTPAIVELQNQVISLQSENTNLKMEAKSLEQKALINEAQLKAKDERIFELEPLVAELNSELDQAKLRLDQANGKITKGNVFPIEKTNY